MRVMPGTSHHELNLAAGNADDNFAGKTGYLPVTQKAGKTPRPLSPKKKPVRLIF
jgi:hypothetical protein